MKRKGFTLVELLAVIVILAVIALIAVPQVMKIINQSREDAERQSRLGVTKAFELGIGSGKYQVDTEYNIEEIEADNNPFLSGVIIYDSKTKDIYYSHAVNKKTEVNESGSKRALSEPINNSDNSLAKQLIKAVGTDKTSEDGYYDATDGYIKGGTYDDTKNYVKIPEIDAPNALYRAVRIHPDGRVLVIRNSYKEYGEYNENESTNNFAEASIKEYLNNEFYPLISNQNIITETIWDTRCAKYTGNYPNYTGVEYSKCLSGPILAVAKVGLLTFYDMSSVGDIVGVSGTYLPADESIPWYLGTGYYSTNFVSVFAVIEGFAGTTNVDGFSGFRPAFTLKSNLTVTGDGTYGQPFVITESN